IETLSTRSQTRVTSTPRDASRLRCNPQEGDRVRRRSRHCTAVLGLVGWYLMMSPLNQTNQVNLHAPLSWWLIARSFDSASECENTLMAMQKALWTTEDELNWKAEQAKIEHGERLPLSYSEYAKRTTNAQCVASDDPRLLPMWPTRIAVGLKLTRRPVAKATDAARKCGYRPAAALLRAVRDLRRLDRGEALAYCRRNLRTMKSNLACA